MGRIEPESSLGLRLIFTQNRYVIQVLATITTVDTPLSAAFDGERVFVACDSGSDAIYEAADLSLITARNIASNGIPFGTWSESIRFFFTVPTVISWWASNGPGDSSRSLSLDSGSRFTWDCETRAGGERQSR